MRPFGRPLVWFRSWRVFGFPKSFEYLNRRPPRQISLYSTGKIMGVGALCGWSVASLKCFLDDPSLPEEHLRRGTQQSVRRVLRETKLSLERTQLLLQRTLCFFVRRITRKEQRPSLPPGTPKRPAVAWSDHEDDKREEGGNEDGSRKVENDRNESDPPPPLISVSSEGEGGGQLAVDVSSWQEMVALLQNAKNDIDILIHQCEMYFARIGNDIQKSMKKARQELQHHFDSLLLHERQSLAEQRDNLTKLRETMVEREKLCGLLLALRKVEDHEECSKDRPHVYLEKLKCILQRCDELPRDGPLMKLGFSTLISTLRRAADNIMQDVPRSALYVPGAIQAEYRDVLIPQLLDGLFDDCAENSSSFLQRVLRRKSVFGWSLRAQRPAMATSFFWSWLLPKSVNFQRIVSAKRLMDKGEIASALEELNQLQGTSKLRAEQWIRDGRNSLALMLSLRSLSLFLTNVMYVDSE